MLVILLALVCLGQDAFQNDPKSMLWRAQALEEEGKVTQAWLLYNHLATIDPGNALAVGKATQLRTKALEGAVVTTCAAAEAAVDPNDPLLHIKDEELKDIERLQPPPALAPRDTKLTLDLKGDAKTIYTRILSHFGIDVIFDGDYDNPQNREVRIEDATFEQALYIAGVATGSWVNPIAPKLAMVIKDTDQKRREQERNVAITLPIPTAISSPEAQELARAIQQLFELQRVSVDTVRGMLLVRDRWSKVRLAELAIGQFLRLRGQVMLDVEFFEVNDQSNLSFGFSLPTSTQLVPLVARRTLSFRGATLFGLGTTTANLFASMTHSNTRSLYEAQVRALDGLPATLHIGDRFPIITQVVNFSTSATNAQALAPQIQFEDLGLTLKLTPHLHTNGEVSLEVESEFKVLTGQTNNDIPVIANRKFTGTVRLKPGEWAVGAGLVTLNESVNRAGLAGIANLPVLGQLLSTNGKDRRIGQTLLVIRPRVIGASPSEYPAKEIFTGQEQRFLAPTRY
jgi:general secretion pathway protein D